MLAAVLDRCAEKKKPKTESRAKADGDLLVSVLQDPAGSEAPAFREIRARLMVFGETNVLSALADYDKNKSETRHHLLPVILEMRESLLTGHKKDAESAVQALLEQEQNLGRPR
jgi:hypothetical protein